MTTQPTGVELDPRKVSTPGRLVTELGGVVGDLAEHFAQMRDKAETSQAMIELTKQFNAVHGKALQDPDVWGAPQRAQEGLQRAVDDTSRTISSPSARAAYQERAGVSFHLKALAINNQLMKRQIDAGKTSVLLRNDQLVDEFYGSASPKERQALQGEIQANVRDAIRMGYMDPTAGRKYLVDLLAHLHVGQVTSDMELDPANTAKELQKGKEGLYPELNEPQRTHLLKQAQTMEQRKKAEGVRVTAIARNHLETQMLEQYWSGQMTQQGVAEAVASGKISQGFANNLLEAMRSPQVAKHTKTDATEYIRLVDQMLRPDADPGAVKQDLLKAVADGRISNSVAQRLYTTHMIPTPEGAKESLAGMVRQQAVDKAQQIIMQDEQEQQRLKDKQNWLRSAVSFIKQWAGGDEEKTADWLHSYQRKLAPETQGQALVEHAQTVVKEGVRKDHPSVNALEDVPHSVGSFREGVQEVWGGESKVKAAYEIRNGTLVPKEQARYSVGQMVTGQGQYAGRRFRVIRLDEQGRPVLRKAEDGAER